MKAHTDHQHSHKRIGVGYNTGKFHNGIRELYLQCRQHCHNDIGHQGHGLSKGYKQLFEGNTARSVLDHSGNAVAASQTNECVAHIEQGHCHDTHRPQKALGKG